AEALAEDVFATCPPEPVRDVDPAVLARLSLRRLANVDPARTQRRPAAPRGRHRRRRSRRARVVGVGLTVALLAGTVGVTGAWRAAIGHYGDVRAGELSSGGASSGGASSGDQGSGDASGGGQSSGAGSSGDQSSGDRTSGDSTSGDRTSGEPVAVVDRPAQERGALPAERLGVLGAAGAVPLDVPPAAAAVRLTHHRAEALLAGDTARLSAVTVPGSPAAAADLQVLASMGPARDAVAPGVVRTQVADVDVEPRTARPLARWGSDCHGVRLVAAVRGTPAGDVSAPSMAGAAANPSVVTATPVRLTLCAVGGAWRVAVVEPVVG
ncbi:hypothetical protein ICW40_15560, partial [Actinotalea ferrariae]|uniref:hypothetical protein n=1 Tax=Actinotalea ferrariae TaxID=1386098 RepID=UPI001C8B7633